MEWLKEKINKHSGPNKYLMKVAERSQELLNSVPVLHREVLENIIHQYRDVFPGKLPKGAPSEREVQHQIKVNPGSGIPYRPSYWLVPIKQDDVEDYIKDPLDQGFSRSFSSHSAPAFFVPKKDSKWGNYTDYKALNKRTIKDFYPLPRIDLLLDRLSQVRAFSKVDLVQGHRQIAMAEDSIEKTAFCTHTGQWVYVGMPCVICNSPFILKGWRVKSFERR